MGADFSVMEQHLKEPRAPARGGKLVFSRMAPGTSVLGAKAPSVKMVLEGEELYQIDGRTIRIRPGQYLYLDAGADCLGTNRTETLGLCLMLPITNDNAKQDWSRDSVLGRAIALSAATSNMGQKLFEYGRQIARDPSLGPRLAPLIVESVRQSLHAPLLESCAAMARLNAAKASTRRELFQRLDCARAHLHEHLDRSVSLTELAGIARLSQFHLARYFKLAFGRAPIAYHRALRLERAARFLSSGSGSVAEAAEAAGYSDQTALSHAFSRHFGKPPQQWALSARR